MKVSTCLLTIGIIAASSCPFICTASESESFDQDLILEQAALKPFSLIQILAKETLKQKVKKSTKSSGDSFLQIKGAGKLSDKPGMESAHSPKQNPVNDFNEQQDQDLSLFQDPVEIHLYGKDYYSQSSGSKKQDSNSADDYRSEFQLNWTFESEGDSFCG